MDILSEVRLEEEERFEKLVQKIFDFCERIGKEKELADQVLLHSLASVQPDGKIKMSDNAVTAN